MSAQSILFQRMHNQGLASPLFKRAEDYVETLGAVQAQDFPNSKWGIGMRLLRATDETLNEAYDKGKILRTHVMRPTWHYVSPHDIKWMQSLTGPRVMQLMSYYNRKLELSPQLFTKSSGLIECLLRGDNYLTRQEIGKELHKTGIILTPQKVSHLVMQAELEGLICSGPLKGKQHTYALIEERAPKARTLSREAALKELVLRYFTSHGPATIKDFVWWSGLTVKDTQHGIHLNGRKLHAMHVNEQSFYFSPKQKPAKIDPEKMYLLPNYDEYTIGYTSKHALFLSPQTILSFGVGFYHAIMQNGMIIGTWKRARQKNHFTIQTKFTIPPSSAQREALQEAADQYGEFFGMKAKLSYP